MTLPPLPIGDCGFEDIRSRKMPYADKTGYISELLPGNNRACYLSRPGRFRKTLLLSTLQSLFSGDRRLFEGLDIARSDYAFPKIPVIRMSLPADRTDPTVLGRRIKGTLGKIAAEFGLDVRPDAPGAYFREVIKALSRASKSEIAVLIDDCGAPVIGREDDLDVAGGNAVVHDFLSVLREYGVLDHVRFSLVTGTTPFALTSLDSEPNPFEDISLDPEYAGICGFTAREFDGLFADRMEPLLKALKARGQIAAGADVGDLRNMIFDWYDGYYWGGEARILNPCSILLSFHRNELSDHWVRSGRPTGYLTDMIRKDPEAFFQPEFKPCSEWDLRGWGLDGPQVLPALFHGGYLTLDKISYVPEKYNETGIIHVHKTYSLKYPNFEVESSIIFDFFKVFFEKAKPSQRDSDSIELAAAFLDRDAETVGAIFGKYFAAIPRRRRPALERDFHSHVLALLMGLGFKLGARTPGAGGRPALSVELPDGVHVVIELKHRPSADKLGGAERNRVLANLAMFALAKEERYQSLAELAVKKLDAETTFEILDEHPAGARRYELLALAAAERLPKAVTDKALAAAMERKFPAAVINEALNKAAPDAYLTRERIESELSGAAQSALDAVTEKNRRAMAGRRAKEIIGLGLAAFGREPKVKAIFAPKPPSS